MRTFEVVLVAANLVALVLLVAPLRGQALWRTVAAARRPGERLGGGRAAALGVGLGVPGLALSALLPLLLPVFHLPTPTGRYGIGTLTYHWVDQHRPEVLAENPDARRELMVQVWYPAEDTAGQLRAPYIPDAGAVAHALARLRHLPTAALGHLKHVTSNAVEAAPVAGDRYYLEAPGMFHLDITDAPLMSPLAAKPGASRRRCSMARAADGFQRYALRPAGGDRASPLRAG